MVMDRDDRVHEAGWAAVLQSRDPAIEHIITKLSIHEIRTLLRTLIPALASAIIKELDHPEGMELEMDPWVACKNCGQSIRYHPADTAYLHVPDRWPDDNGYWCMKGGKTFAEPFEEDS